MITGGFGMTMDLERGTMRQWAMGRDGVKRWADNGDPVATMTDEQKALAYYKAALEQEAPPWVPARVRLAREVFGDPPFRGAGVAAGEHDCNCNKWGAVDVVDRAGQRLGLRPKEFTPIAWRENKVPNAPLEGTAGAPQARREPASEA